MTRTGNDADLTCDVAIIGAGTAGLSAERAARKAGARTLLIDEAFAGTVCANVGCMPSKLLIAAANAAHGARQADVFGVRVPQVDIDGPAVLARLRHERDAFVTATLASIAELPQGITVKARARFTAPDRLELDDGRKVAFRAAVIATGAHPMLPPPFARLDSPRIHTNRTIFEIADLPASLAVIGGGAIGLEMAQAMARLGVHCVLFDRETQLANCRDDAVHAALHDAVSREVVLKLGCDPVPTAEAAGIRLDWTGDDAGSALFDMVLVATGRPPTLEGLGLDAAGLDLDDHVVPVFDADSMQCGKSAIFIAGDANADRPVLHEASTEGAIAGRNAARFPDIRPGRRGVPFTLTFTDPPLASIGADPSDAALTGQSDYGDQGRAKVEARAEGVLRLGADRDGRLTGADMCTPGTGHLAHLLAWSIQSGATASELLGMPFYHPTLEEGLRSALRQICDASDQPQPESHDTGIAPGC